MSTWPEVEAHLSLFLKLTMLGATILLLLKLSFTCTAGVGVEEANPVWQHCWVTWWLPVQLQVPVSKPAAMRRGSPQWWDREEHSIAVKTCWLSRKCELLSLLH